MVIAFKLEGLLTQLLEEGLFPKGNASTSGAMWFSDLVLDSLACGRRLLSGKGKSNNLWLMFYEKCWHVVTETKPFSLFLISIVSLCKLNLDIEQIMREISKYCFG